MGNESSWNYFPDSRVINGSDEAPRKCLPCVDALPPPPCLCLSLLRREGGGKLIKWSLDTFVTSVLAPPRGWVALRVVWEAPTLVVCNPQLGSNQLWQLLPKQGTNQARFLLFFSKRVSYCLYFLDSLDSEVSWFYYVSVLNFKKSF